MAQSNPMAAFVAFCSGVPVEEIALSFGMSEDSLRQRINREGWASLRAKMPPVEAHATTTVGGLPVVPDEREAKLVALQVNRARNLKVFEDLREHLIDVVQRLKGGQLVMEKHFNFKGHITTVQVPPTSGDWVNIASYAKTIAEGTYRALGDFAAQEKVGQDAIAGQASAPAITIILPGAIAAPRNERIMEGQVIDLTSQAEPHNDKAE